MPKFSRLRRAGSTPFVVRRTFINCSFWSAKYQNFLACGGLFTFSKVYIAPKAPGKKKTGFRVYIRGFCVENGGQNAPKAQEKNEVFGVYIRGFRTKNGAEGAGKFWPKSSKILRFCPNPVKTPPS